MAQKAHLHFNLLMCVGACVLHRKKETQERDTNVLKQLKSIKMKKLIVLISLVFWANLSFAQRPNQQRPERPTQEQMIERATKELSLTEAQVNQWKEIHIKYEAAMKDRSKANETRKAMGKELEATLNNEQLKKFKKMRENQPPPPPRQNK
jgi:uncharacterized protein with von Willebrand factor type A (vWA) domain